MDSTAQKGGGRPRIGALLVAGVMIAYALILAAMVAADIMRTTELISSIGAAP